MKEYNSLLMAAEQCKDAQCFIFDMDGLIFDTELIFMNQLAVAMAEKGYSLSRKVYEDSLGMTGEPLKQLMLSEYGQEYPFEEMGEKARAMVDIIADTVGLPVKPQIRPLLEWLKEQEIICAVASSSPSDAVQHYLEKAELLPFFKEIIGGEMVERSKPEPDIFLLACKKCNVLPEKAVVLEDSENGIRAAYAAGIKNICVPDLKWPCEEVQRLIGAIVAVK